MFSYKFLPCFHDLLPKQTRESYEPIKENNNKKKGNIKSFALIQHTKQSTHLARRAICSTPSRSYTALSHPAYQSHAHMRTPLITSHRILLFARAHFNRLTFPRARRASFEKALEKPTRERQTSSAPTRKSTEEAIHSHTRVSSHPKRRALVCIYIYKYTHARTHTESERGKLPTRRTSAA